ncbi:hypothetical protein [Sphingomonas melonis]|uniref:Uncharacterized protein n=1 Tax=Sphingomonas melonis TaxID=152682 RepID=A0A7Y9K1T8_9SPHN|nr:hypothetical protein [Sphingomonas melonis]NYD88730.1 hypothetical protein [Sphingomonas melonis]
MSNDITNRAGDFEKAYFERGMFAAYAWMVTRKRGEQLSDAVVEDAWEHRDEGMGPTECLPTRPVIAAVGHPLDGATLQEVFDYAARRLADASADAGEPRELRLAVDRFDEAYMWMVAATPQEPPHA